MVQAKQWRREQVCLGLAATAYLGHVSFVAARDTQTSPALRATWRGERRGSELGGAGQGSDVWIDSS
eukprot:g19450.t1